MVLLFGIVGALVLGEAAVSAGIVSPILIIVVAITGISSLTIPDFSFGFHLRYFRFAFILLGGVPFMAPLAPPINSEGNGYFLPPIWKREYRPPYVSPKVEKSQDKISMKWKFSPNFYKN